MLPSLTAGVSRRPPRRVLAGVASLSLFAAAVAGPAFTADAPVPEPSSLAMQLPPSSWGLAIPMSWFAAPPANVRAGDRIDIIAMRSSERPNASAIAFDLEVISVDERTLVVGVSAFDASAIAVARAGGHLIVPLVRSTR